MKGRTTKHQTVPPRSDRAILQFVGDISLNGLFCDPQYHEALTRNMIGLAESLGRCDLCIGNWESPLWGDGGVNVLKEPRLCTTAGAAECILPLSLDVALLANNHIYDCLEKGFENTVQFLQRNGIRYLGAGTDQAKAREPLILARNGWKFGLLNYVGPETNPNMPAGGGVFLNMIEEERLLAEVASLAAQVDIVVLNLHWGAELVRYPSLEQRRLARRAVEAGAKVVVCHHSHCLQGHESWKEGHIFYSLGNFLFLKGKESRQWSKFSRRTAVAICEVSRAGVEQADLKFFCQQGLTLRPDETLSRAKKQNRLNQRLKLPDAKYKRLHQREMLLQWVVISPFRFIVNSGGLFKALRRLKWDHVVAAFDILTKKT